jgi:3-methyladenine DNA glycosylase/8-oxoguanine DNA glycosylase
MPGPDASLALAAAPGFSLVRSQGLLRLGALDRCMRIEDGEVWRATRTPDGPASYRAVQEEGEVRVQIWGPGVDWVRAHAPALLGLADDPHAFEPAHEKLARMHARKPIYLARTLRLFERLTATILHQLVTWREATESWANLIDAHGDDAPGPGRLRLPPTARILARLSPDRMSEYGVLGRHARTIHRAATTIARLDPEAHDADTLSARLQAIPGVGPWTAQVTLAAVVGHPDAVPTGDFHLPHTIAWALAGEERGDDDRMLELLEPFRGHRWRVICLIREAGIHAPRRGAKRGVPAHRRHRRGRS